MVTTRPAERRDVGRVTRLAQDAFRHYTPRIGRAPAPMATDYAAAVAKGGVWVAEDDGDVLGVVVLADADDHLNVDILAVDPAVQGRGVGAQLLALAEAEAGRRGYDRVTLCTNEAMTENLDYYPRRGYVETDHGEEDGYRRVFFTKML